LKSIAVSSFLVTAVVFFVGIFPPFSRVDNLVLY
jgi:hypothetical protein